jgi:hypothetical protein
VLQNDELLAGPGPSATGKQRLLHLTKVVAHRPYHVVLTQRRGTITAFVDGDQIVVREAPLLDIAEWEGGQLSFGQAADGSGDWPGSAEGIALYDRALTGHEAGQHYRAYARRLGQRRPLPALTVQAQLMKTRDAPKASAYSNTLVVFDYHIEAIIKGSCSEERVLVAHWGNLNGERQRAPQELRVGHSYRHTLEPFDDHPELSSVQIIMGDADFSLPLFFASGDP